MKYLFPLRVLARILVTALLTGAVPFCTGTVAAGDGRLVLVAGPRSPITRLTLVEVRQIYLGRPLALGGRMVKAIRNVSDARVDEIFLQRVMFMSRESYERQIAARAERSGRPLPPAYGDVQALLRALERDPMAVTYMPRDWAASQAGLRVIAEP